MSDDSQVQKTPIPDIWYDFISRLLPGFMFVLAVRYIYLAEESSLDVPTLIILASAGYGLGFFSNPMSSFIAGIIESIVVKVRGYEVNYVRESLHILGRESRDSLIISKMHAETVAFVQAGIFSLLFALLNTRWPSERSTIPPEYPIGLSLVLFWFAFSVSSRRLSRTKMARTHTAKTQSR